MGCANFLLQYKPSVNAASMVHLPRARSILAVNISILITFERFSAVNGDTTHKFSVSHLYIM